MRVLAGSVLVFLLVAAPAAAADDACTPIRFDKGAAETTLTGAAPAEGVVCYTLAVSAGAAAVVRLLGTKNVMVAVEGVGDGQTEIAFTARRGTYRIEVSQLMRALEPEPFRLFVSVAPAR